MPKRPLSDEEKKLLAEAMKDVVPLAKKMLAPAPEKPAAKKPKILKKPQTIEYAAPAPKGVADSQTVKHVMSGVDAIDAKLDLHGLTLDEAFRKLKRFVENQHAKGAKTLLVITGKGGNKGEKGQLQREVPRWLSLSDMASRILVVSIARPKHGGEGALYVRLRRNQ